ncbi:hypothetical protein [Caudoviricetes sp.]|nr:hypothetical protein [Caudoviricetes sp.]
MLKEKHPIIGCRVLGVFFTHIFHTYNGVIL